MRKTLFWLTLLAGLALAIVGFMLAAPIGPVVDSASSNPRLPFAPTIFVLGILLLFGSALVYELLPNKIE